MAFTTPKSWSVGELVTAANLNTHLRDNLRYLKGLDGTITLDADLAVTRSAAGSTVGAYVDNTGGSSSGTLSRFTLGMTPAETNALLLQFDHNANEASIFNRASGGNLILQTNNANMILQTNGVGLSVTAPTGKLHGYNTISGFLAWEYDGVDGTARTVINNGTGDVLYVFSAMFVVRDSAGTTYQGITNNVVPSGTYNLVSDGSNTLRLQVAADGSVNVQRTLGSRTYKVALWCLWL